MVETIKSTVAKNCKGKSTKIRIATSLQKAINNKISLLQGKIH